MDERIIRQWYEIFKDNKQLTEIRIIDPYTKGRVYSGYFTDVESIIDAIRIHDDKQIYFTLNEIKEACYSRIQRDKVIPGATSTSGNDIEKRNYILVDLDVVRPANTDSSDAELEDAKEVARNVYRFLRDQGFSLPAVCMSGNGVHLLMKCDLPNNDESTKLVKDFLAVLDMLFTTEKVHVDLAPCDPNRICKLYGTVSRKGSNTKDRPYRVSYIMSVPDDYKVSPKEYFQKVAAMLPEKKIDKFTGYSSESFDLDAFIEAHNIGIVKKSRFSAGIKYILEECPFDSNHKAPDAALFKMDNGAISFKCLHNSCQHYGWREFRLHYDPSAYDVRAVREVRREQRLHSREPIIPEVRQETSEIGPKWKTMSDIKYVDPSAMPHMLTGIDYLDRRMMGLMLGEVSVVSGCSGSGKSSLLNNIILNVCDRGYKAGLWSGEIPDYRFQAWIDQTAAGKNFVYANPEHPTLFYAQHRVVGQINSWLDGKLFLYNNDYGNQWSQLYADVENLVEKHNVNLIVLDNLTALDIDSYDTDTLKAQKKLINDLRTFANKKQVHIILVCHPRKESGSLIRKESISGSLNITDLAQNVIIVHRVGRDFQKKATMFFGEETTAEMMMYDEIVEICKSRSAGIEGDTFGLYYEVESRRFKNTQSEHIVYGWQDRPSERPLSFDEDMPEEFC